ncbi:protein kinase domain-containing protein [Paenibacillus taiwanensis]|uniref:protein kinase domain-containing protein n=1 Tax=Paenibacillus taiwanensis TaxID=401638 RepID=UPI001FE22F5B|nr:serine/threonine protein kinase [Paenibacillus taiwanensis]
MTTSYKRQRTLERMQEMRAAVLKSGEKITGLWNNRTYRIVRLLGQGANGVVYYVERVRSNGDHSRPVEGYALKVGGDAIEFQSEINALKALEKIKRQQASGSRVGRDEARPFLVEADDTEIAGQKIPFYVMRYVPGMTLSVYMRKRGSDWFGFIGGKLLSRLEWLHENGWVFGDIKADNVLVRQDGDVELVDYGGLTPAGSSIRQFTEWYDRGYWNAGSRVADFGYDLFSFAVLTVHLFNEEKLKQRIAGVLPQIRQREDLMAIIRECPVLNPYESWLCRAIHSKFHSTRQAKEEWVRISKQVYRMPRRAPRPTPSWLKMSFAGSALLLLISVLYWAWREQWWLG